MTVCSLSFFLLFNTRDREERKRKKEKERRERNVFVPLFTINLDSFHFFSTRATILELKRQSITIIDQFSSFFTPFIETNEERKRRERERRERKKKRREMSISCSEGSPTHCWWPFKRLPLALSSLPVHGTLVLWYFAWFGTLKNSQRSGE